MTNEEITIPILEIKQDKTFNEMYIDNSLLKSKLNQLSEENTLTRNESSAISLKHTLNDLYLQQPMGPILKSFIQLINEEFKKFYSNFLKKEKDLYRQLNQVILTCILQTNLTILEVLGKFEQLISLAYELKQNIISNMTIVVNIMKEADDKCYPIFHSSISILFFKSHLDISNSDIEYVLQFKLIDEACLITSEFIGKFYTLKKSKFTEAEKIQCSKILDIVYKIDTMDNPYQILFNEWYNVIENTMNIYNNRTNIIMPSLRNPMKDYLINDNEVLLLKLLSDKIIQRESSKKKNSCMHLSNLIMHVIHGVLSIYLQYDIIGLLDLSLINGIQFIILWGIFILSNLLSTFIYLYFPTNKYKSTLVISFMCMFISKLLIFFKPFQDHWITNNYYIILSMRIIGGIGCNTLINKKYFSIFTQKNNFSSLITLNELFKSLAITLTLIPYLINYQNKYDFLFSLSASICFILFIISIFAYVSPNSNKFTVISSDDVLEKYLNRNKNTHLFPGDESGDENIKSDNNYMTVKEREKISKIEQEFQKMNITEQFRNVNKIPNIINSIINQQTFCKKSLGYVILILLILVFLINFLNEIFLMRLFLVFIQSDKLTTAIIIIIILISFTPIIVYLLSKIISNKYNNLLSIIIYSITLILCLLNFVVQFQSYFFVIFQTGIIYFLLSYENIQLGKLLSRIIPPSFVIKNITTINLFYYFSYIGKLSGILVFILLYYSEVLVSLIISSLLFISLLIFILHVKHFRIKATTRIMSSLYNNKLK